MTLASWLNNGLAKFFVCPEKAVTTRMSDLKKLRKFRRIYEHDVGTIHDVRVMRGAWCIPGNQK